jgi:hypothetical protein
MAIPAPAALRAQLHCLSHDGRAVLTAQQWYDRAAPAQRPRSWLRLVGNGRVIQDCRFTGERGHREMERFWADRVVDYEPTKLTEDQMWAKLWELARIEQTRCQRKDCAGGMPVAWWFCPGCGTDARKVAVGSLSGCRRRGDLTLRQKRPS